MTRSMGTVTMIAFCLYLLAVIVTPAIGVGHVIDATLRMVARVVN